ncbi:DUF3596 domain-containing protein [Pseudomonas sp. TMP25]|uniref:Arm DNA-binding domain-containing protein n=1 Tax=Pseudomonas sp. TMP25 TaxID=3136561 RepID=UPI0031013019
MQDEMKTSPDQAAIPCTLVPCDEPARTLSALPTGVERHGKGLRISFTYAGERCREVVERGQNDELSIAIAGRIRQRVVDSIAADSFDYLKRFPDSATARRLSQSKVEQGSEFSSPS